MSRDIVTIAPEASMAEAAGIMGEKHIGSLIVTKYDTPVGIVTERDLLSKVLALGKEKKDGQKGIRHLLQLLYLLNILEKKKHMI